MMDLPGALKSLDDIKGGKPFSEFLAPENHKDWPKEIRVPYNSEVRGTVYTWEHREKRLDNFHDMKSRLYVDSDGNRKLMMLEWNTPFFGKENLDVYCDFDEGLIVKSMRDTKFCKEGKLGKKINLKDIIDRLNDPHGGLMEYLGEKQVDWAHQREKFHAFRVNMQTKDFRKEEILYFNTDGMDLEWIETIKPLPFVIGIENGLEERKFSDEDFKDVKTRCDEEDSGVLGWV